MKLLLCPSLANLTVENFVHEIRTLDEAGCDIFHIDIMDGHFVLNFGMGLPEFETVRAHTKKMVDVHLIITEPSRFVEFFAQKGADIIYIHPEADTHPARTLSKIRSLGVKSGIAINPGTSIETVKELFPLVDYVMPMTVNPGFHGQVYMDYVEPKILRLAEMKDQYGYKIVIDGGVTVEIMERLYKAGVEGYVIGNFVIFKQEQDYKTIVDRLRKMENT